MPLLGKEPFVKKQLPEDISPEEQVFVCKATNEAFLTYDEFFERQILCSSMVWTCCMTNRTGLTYEEALQSERNAIEMLNSFPTGLQIPVLYLMNYINEWKFNSIVDLIYSFVCNRFFVAEDIQIPINSKRKIAGKVFRVMAPKESPKSDDNVDPNLFEYEIIDDQNIRHIVSADKISRSKGFLNKDKIKLFLKQHLTPTKRFETAVVKESSKQRFSLNKIEWSHIFAGPEPVFKCQIDQTFDSKPSTSDKKKSSDKNKINNKENPDSKKGKNSLSSDKKKNIEDKTHKKSKSDEDNKQKLKDKEKEEKLSQKRKYEEWSAKRDDLACDDLQPLPETVPLKCQIPVNLFADSLLVMEFFHSFKDLFDIKKLFPSGITFELMEQILFDTDTNGPFADLMKVLMTSNFSLMEEQDSSDSTDDHSDNSDDEERPIKEELPDIVPNVQEKRSAYYYQWIHNTFGTNLSKVTLNPFTMTEVLRLYLLSSGGRPEVKDRYRRLNSREDPAIDFIDQNPSILSKLENNSIFDLNPKERLKIFHVLIHQLLSYFDFREKIDDTFEEMTKLRKKIRDIQMEFNKWTKDNKPLHKKEQNESQKSIASNSSSEDKKAFREEKSQKEEEKLKSLDEIRSKLRKLQACYVLNPIGVDRAFRKYWIFESLPGLFVEHSIPDTKHTNLPYGPCLSNPTPITSLKNIEYICDKSESQRDDSSTTSDKENEVMSETNDRNGYNSCCLRQLSVFDKCTANINTCEIHGIHTNDTNNEWTFYHTSEQLECLIQNLNIRGFRENQLKFALNRDKNIIIDYLNRCQAYKLNTDIPVVESRRSQRLQYTLHSRKRKASVQQDLSETFTTTFTEDLISLEEKLFAASLAVVTEMSRNEWRKSLESTSSDKQKFIEKMRNALLVLERSVRPMCLSASLNEDNWSQALFNSSSISQLFVYLSVLDDSIKWSKSAREAYCKICRRRCDPQNMLLCDQCNRGHHIYCLQPSLDAIPKGEWFCPECCPKPQSPKKDKKVKRIYESECDSSDPEESDDSYSDEELDSLQNSRSVTPNQNMEVCTKCRKVRDEEQLWCMECRNMYHLRCTDLKRITRSDWFCPKCCNGSEQKRKQIIELDFDDDSQSTDSFSSESRPSKRTRYSQDSDYMNEREKLRITTSMRRRSDRHSPSICRSFTSDLGLCEEILMKLQRHPKGWLFVNRPNYAVKKVVKQYMDLNQVKFNLKTAKYKSSAQFFRDILLMLNNASFYNQKDSEEYKTSQSLSQYFHTLLDEYDIDLNNSGLDL